MQAPELANRVQRRRVLAGLGLAVSGLVAGCGSTTENGTPTEPTFDQLDVTSVHVADDVDLSVPDAVSTVDARTNATLLVMPGDAAVDAAQVADWLADEKVIGLFGPAAEATWIDWAESEAISDHFDTEGVSDAEPDPQLVVAAAVGLSLPTFRSTWDEEPSDRDVLTALDDALVDVHERREADQ